MKLNLWRFLNLSLICLGFLIFGCTSDNRLRGVFGDSSIGALNITYQKFVPPNGSESITVTGGKAPYTFSVLSGAGSVSSSGVFTAPGGPEVGKVLVSDSEGQTETLTFEVFQAGVLDKTFGTEGFLSWQPNLTSDEQGKDVLVDSQGYYYVLSHSYMGPVNQNDILVSKYSSSGILDTTFATGGVFQYDNSGRTEVSRSFLLDSQDRLVIGGKCQMPGTSGDFCILRLTPDGALDPTFGTAGVFIHAESPGGVAEEVREIAFDSLGNIVFVGFIDDTTNTVVVGRLTPAGALDTNFNTTGIRQIDVLGLGTNAQALSVHVDSSDNIYFAGHVFVDGTTQQVSYVIKLDNTGAYDPGFGTGGTKTFDVNTTAADFADDLIEYDGQLYLLGRVNNGVDMDAYVIRFEKSDGAIDPTFGTGGVFQWDSGNGADKVDGSTGIMVDESGRILVLLSSNNGTDPAVALIRLLNDGTLDSSFGTSGVEFTTISGGTSVSSRGMQFDPMGKIIVTGFNGTASNSNDIFIMRTWYEH